MSLREEEEDTERQDERKIPRNTDRFYPDSYHVVDHTPDQDEE